MECDQPNVTETTRQERPSSLNLHETALPPVRFSRNEAQDRPVQLISIKPLVDDDLSERRKDATGDKEETSRQTGLSKYNWKNFLPIARR